MSSNDNNNNINSNDSITMYLVLERRDIVRLCFFFCLSLTAGIATPAVTDDSDVVVSVGTWSPRLQEPPSPSLLLSLVIALVRLVVEEYEEDEEDEDAGTDTDHAFILLANLLLDGWNALLVLLGDENKEEDEDDDDVILTILLVLVLVLDTEEEPDDDNCGK